MWKLGVLPVTVLAAALVLTGNWWASLLAGGLCTVASLALRASMVVVPARRAAAIFNRLEFYSGLRGPGLAFILPLWEHVAFTLDLAPRLARITVGDLHTRDQVPVTISLDFLYRLEPWQIPPELRPQLLDALEASTPGILERHAAHVLHRLVGQQDVAALLQPDARARLEERLTRDLTRRLAGSGLALADAVTLGAITLPEALQAELNQAQQARVRARAWGEALNALRQVLSVHPDGAWDKAIEVEALDAMSRGGAPLCWACSTCGGWGAGGSGVNGKS